MNPTLSTKGPAPRTQGEIPSLLDALQQALDFQDQQINQLVARLDPVLLPVEVPQVRPSIVIPDSSTGVGNQLRSAIERVLSRAATLAETTDNLAL